MTKVAQLPGTHTPSLPRVTEDAGCCYREAKSKSDIPETHFLNKQQKAFALQGSQWQCISQGHLLRLLVISVTVFP